MKLAALKIAPLVLLALAPAASRLSASGDSPVKQEKKKKVVIAAPEKKIVVDGDRVVLWDDADGADGDFDAPGLLADLPDLEDEDLPRVLRIHGHRSGGYLGVRSIEMTPELRQHFGAPREAGVFVGAVSPDSPAARGGLQVGDIVTAIDGEGIGSTRELSRSVRRHKGGDKLGVDLLRDRSKKSLSVTVVERKDEEVRVGDLGHGMRGFRWRDWDLDGPAVAPVAPVPPVPPVPPVAAGPRWDGLRDRLESLEQRLKEIESRLPPR